MGGRSRLRAAGVRTASSELLGELGHLRAACRTGRTKHVTALGSLLHRCLIVRNSLLLLTLYTEHFSQSTFPPLSEVSCC